MLFWNHQVILVLFLILALIYSSNVHTYYWGVCLDMNILLWSTYNIFTFEKGDLAQEGCLPAHSTNWSIQLLLVVKIYVGRVCCNVVILHREYVCNFLTWFSCFIACVYFIPLILRDGIRVAPFLCQILLSASKFPLCQPFFCPWLLRNQIFSNMRHK